MMNNYRMILMTHIGQRKLQQRLGGVRDTPTHVRKPGQQGRFDPGNRI